MNNNNLIYGIIGVGIGYYMGKTMQSSTSSELALPSSIQNYQVNSSEIDNMLQYQQEKSAYQPDSMQRPLNPDDVFVNGHEDNSNPLYSSKQID